MEQLSDQQIDMVLDRINTGITDANLQNGLLDHYCCYIEEAMSTGCGFEVAYDRAFKAITPNGTQEIQEELFFLLTFKTQTNMKRIVYGAGCFAAFCISSGYMCRYFHWFGGAEVLEVGFVFLMITVVTILVNAIKHIKIHSPAYNFRVFIGLLAGMLVSFGNLFKLHSLHGGNVLIILGMFILNFLFLPLFFFHLYKQSLTKT